MDRAENLLTGGGELSEESDKVVCGLTIETRGRLVQEQKQVRLGSELDTDGDSLSRLDRETVAAAGERSARVVRELGNSRETNHRIREVLQLEQLNDILTVVVLLLLRNILRLTEVSGESESLSDSRRPLVHILLLGWASARCHPERCKAPTISTTTLELDTDRSAVHEDITLDHTRRFSRRKHIKQRSLRVNVQFIVATVAAHLSSSRGTHERRQRSRLDITIHIREQLLLPALNRHMVVLPSAPAS